jgi:hypothetical protein
MNAVTVFIGFMLPKGQTENGSRGLSVTPNKFSLSLLALPLAGRNGQEAAVGGNQAQGGWPRRRARQPLDATHWSLRTNWGRDGDQPYQRAAHLVLSLELHLVRTFKIFNDLQFEK